MSSVSSVRSGMSSNHQSNSQTNKRGCKESIVWEHFFKETIGDGHFSAKCHYCAEAWSRGKPEFLKGHLALHCSAVPTNIKLEYMQILIEQPLSSNKTQKINSSNPSITNYFDSSAEVDASKRERINQALAKGFQNTIFREMSLFAMKIWTDFGGGTNSCKILMAQIRKYSENYPPYDMEYIDNHDTPEICTHIITHKIQTLHFLRIDTTRLQSMAQIHSFYITNAKTELNYPNSDLTDDELDTTIQEITAAMAEDDDLFEYSEDNDLFEYGEEEEGEDQNEEEDESLGLNNDILFMEDIMNLSLGFDENGNEDESTTRNEQEIFDHGNRNVNFDAIFSEELLE
ncbi:5813_t:CDS:2 [Entrophospora sp. SA101]|nr:5813_t:CDS:2 [Entrophospora sp. SA101]